MNSSSAAEIAPTLNDLNSSSSSAAEMGPTSDDFNSFSSAAEMGPTSDDFNPFSSAAEMGTTLDDFNSSNWSLGIDSIFSINTPNLPVEIEEILNSFNTSDLPARPPEVEFTRSSSAENFTDTGSMWSIDTSSDSSSNSSRSLERLSGAASSNSRDRGYGLDSDSDTFF